MVKNIPILGLSTNPNNNTSTDGNLAAVVNLHHDRGAITPASITAPQLIMKLPEEYSVIYQHYNEGYRHLIISKLTGSTITYYWLDCTSSIPAQLPVSSLVQFNYIDSSSEHVALQNIKLCVSVGNTLIFYSDTECYYYLFNNKAASLAYIYLGNRIPELNLSFTLKSHTYRTIENECGSTASYPDLGLLPRFVNTLDTAPTEDSDGKHVYVFDGADESAFSTCIHGAIDMFANKFCNRYNYFYQPFFVRYALRMFDGSYVNHSAPILMVPTNAQNPIVNLMHVESGSTVVTVLNFPAGTTFSFDAVGVACSLKYYVKNSIDVFQRWDDLIKAVDIFVSAPISTYDPAQVFNKIEYTGSSIVTDGGFRTFVDPIRSLSAPDNNPPFANRFGAIFESLPNYNLYPSNNSCWVYPTSGGMAWGYGNKKWKYGNERSIDTPIKYDPSLRVQIPLRSNDAISKLAESTSTFFLLKSYSINELLTDEYGTDIENEEYYLSSIYNQQQLTGDLDSHHQIIPNAVCAYNYRLNLADIKKRYFDGFPVSQWYQGINSDLNHIDVYPFVFIKHGGTYAVKKAASYRVLSNCRPMFYFYPDPDAYKLVLVYQTASRTYKYINCDLHEHPSLNGAYWYGNLFDVGKTIVFDSEDTGTLYQSYLQQCQSNPWIYMPASLYTSEQANPFAYRSANIEQVGDGRILAITPLALALSQEQFGSYPLAAFTTDGVWALSPNQTGGWAGVKPFTRDVLLNEDPNNILQLDHELLFASSQGLMLMAPSSDGVQCQCITDVFDGMPDQFMICSSTGFQDGYQYLKQHLLAGTDITLSAAQINPSFKQFIANCRMLWDSAHQRIIVGNPNYPYAYVFNKADKLWTSVHLQIQNSVNSYPQCFAQTKHNLGYYCDATLYNSAVPSLPIWPTCTITRQTSEGVYVVFHLSSEEDESDSSNVYYSINKAITTDDPEIRWGKEFFIPTGVQYHFKYTDINDQWSNFNRVSVSAPTNHWIHLLTDFSRSFGTGVYPIADNQTQASAAASAVGLPASGFFVTRPFHIDDPSALKTITSLMLRGQYAAGSVKMILLGSRDLYRYHVLSGVQGGKIVRLHGSPYKTFRLAVYTKLSASEYLLSADLMYANKLTNKLR